MKRRAGCGKSARPDLWEQRGKPRCDLTPYTALLLDAHSRASVTVVLLDALWVVPQPSHDGAKGDVRNHPERTRARPGGFRGRIDTERQRRMRFSPLPPSLSSSPFTTRGETDHHELTITN
jgi:hypothetical protein